MSQEITPNLGLVIDSNLTATAKQNLRKIDAALANSGLVIDDGVEVNTDGDIFLQPGIGTDDGGDIYVGTSEYPAGTIYMYGATLDLNNVSNIVGYTPTNLTDSSIAVGAEIQQSKISGLLASLLGKEDAFPKADLNSGNPDIISITGGTGVLVNFDATISIAMSGPTADGYLSAIDWNTFYNKEESGVALGLVAGHEMAYNHSDIAHSNRSDLDSVSGTNTGDETTESIKTKLGPATNLTDGYLTSMDWGIFYGKQDALGYTPVNIAGDTMTGQLVLDNQGLVFNIVEAFVGTPTEGTIWWNTDDHTMNIQSDVPGVINQAGLENWLRAKNDTGVTILEGSAVYINGANTARPTVDLADASNPLKSDRVLGIATADILDGQLGVITTFGLVRNLNTSADSDSVAFTDGDCFYLSATQPGKWVKAKPHAPNHCIKLGQIVNAAGGGAGNVFVSVHTGTHLQDLHDVNLETALTLGDTIKYDGTKWVNTPDTSATDIAAIQTMYQDMEDPTGFVYSDAIGVSYDKVERQVTLNHASGFIDYYVNGVKASHVAPMLITARHPDVPDTRYFLHINLAGVGTWTLADGLSPILDIDGAYTAFVNYGASHKFAIRECHGLMPRNSHANAHANIGAYRASGGTASGIIIQSDTVANVTPDLSAMTMWDEDLKSVVNAFAAGADTYTHMYIDALGVAQFSIGNSLPYPVSGSNNIQYNPPGSGLVELTANNQYINIYAMGIPATSDSDSQQYRWIWVVGQSLYTSSAAALAEDIRSFNFGNVANYITEAVIYARFTMRHGTTYSTTTGRARIEVNPTYVVGNKMNLLSVTGISVSGPATRYVNSFVAGDWILVGSDYVLTILGSIHGRGADPMVTVRELTGGTNYRTVYCEVDVDGSTGDITLTSTHTFGGEFIIM